MKDFIYSEQFDDYLKGKMPEDDKLALEQNIQQDPLLNHEVSWQKEIHLAIGEARRAQLKNRLEQVPVSTGGWFKLSASQLATVVASLVITAGGVYYLLQQDEPLTKDVQTVLHVPQHASLQNDTYMPALPEAPAEDQEVSLENSTPAAKIPERLTAQNVAADVMPRIVRPEVMSNFSDQAQDVDYSDFEAPNKNLPQKSEMSNVNVEIENVPDDRFPFHYQFYERKLFLHGDFKGIPYKIIALNRDKDKTFFLEYEGNYYSLRPDQQEIVPLERIQDSTVIRALNKLNR